MTVQRLAVAVLFCAGFNVISVGARESGRPLAVAIPPTGKALSFPSQEMAGAIPAQPPGAAGEADTAPLSEEDYLPLDLPPSEGDQPSAAGEEPAEDTEDLASTAEPVVLGLEPEPPGRSYLVHAQILGLPNSDGFVAASLCTRKNFTKSGCRTERVAASEGEVSVTFTDVAPGDYAVQVHHDQNGNGKMDFSFFGLPKEPYGFSRDAKPMLAPPKFEKASFPVVDGDVSLVIHLQNT